MLSLVNKYEKQKKKIIAKETNKFAEQFDLKTKEIEIKYKAIKPIKKKKRENKKP